MDTSLQIQGLKLQIDHLKMQIEDIIVQNNNSLMMVNPISIGDQILNLSIQMINSGLQAFNTGINLSMNKDKFYDQLSKISQQINNILSSYQMVNQNMVLQQQMIQQQLMQQQMIQQQMMQQQMEEQQRIMEQQNAIMQNKHIINAIFDDPSLGKKNIVVEPDITFKELFEKYKNEIGMERYNEIKYFTTNGYILLKDDNNRLKKCHPNILGMDRIIITVFY